MSLTLIKKSARGLTLPQLRKLEGWLQGQIRRAEEKAQTEQKLPARQIVEERTVENKTYRLEWVRCGKEKCKCARGEMHGPYWYSYVRIKGKLKSQYIGKRLPAGAEQTQP
jgi:hypothetical protein